MNCKECNAIECSNKIENGHIQTSNTLNIKIRKIKENAKLPTRGSAFAAGYDLYSANEDPIVINPGETVKIGTGLQMELPNRTFGAIFARSGLAIKQGLRPSNCVGICDADYRRRIYCCTL